MRIMVVGPVPPYRGGIAHFTSGLASELEKVGHEVLTISYRKQYPKWLYPGKSDQDHTQSRFDANFLFSSYQFSDWRATLASILAYKPDLVIYPWWVSVWAPATAWLLGKLKKAKVPVKVLVHNTFPHEGNTLDKMLTQWALRNVESFVTMTENESKRLRTVIREGADIQIAPHPIYRQFPLSGLSKDELREQLQLPDTGSLLLFFGFVRPYKGLGILLEALALLKEDNIPLHLLVAGEFWEDKQSYEDQITNLGIREMITIRGEYIPDDQVGHYFEAADLFVAPYLDGTQSGSIKQAMSYHLPLVVTNVIADPVILSNPAGCEVVQAGDPKAFAQGIRSGLLTEKAAPTSDLDIASTWSRLITALTHSQDSSK